MILDPYNISSKPIDDSENLESALMIGRPLMFLI